MQKELLLRDHVLQAKGDKSDDDPDGDDEFEDLEELRKEIGITGNENATKAGKAAKLEAKNGETRIKRTIKYMDGDNKLQTRVIYYTDKDKVVLKSQSLYSLLLPNLLRSFYLNIHYFHLKSFPLKGSGKLDLRSISYCCE